MCTRSECINRLNEAAPYIKKEFGVKSLCLFGSMSRGDNHKDSDVDVFVEMPPKMFKVIGLRQYLEDLLGTSVDVVRKHPQINELFLKEIERDGIIIFA